MKRSTLILISFLITLSIITVSLYFTYRTDSVPREPALEHQSQPASSPMVEDQPEEQPIEIEGIAKESVAKPVITTRTPEEPETVEGVLKVVSLIGAPLENDYNVGWITLRNTSDKQFDLKALSIQVTTEGLKMNPGARLRLREDDHIFFQELEYADRTFSGEVYREIPANSERTYKIEVMNPVITDPSAKIVVKFIDFTIEYLDGTRTTIESGVSATWSVK